MDSDQTEAEPTFGAYTPPPLPEAGRQLFASRRRDWIYNAIVNHLHRDPAERWNDYAIGFKQLADVGVEAVGDRHQQRIQTQVFADTIVYPVLFCYRQYLEASLKGLIFAAERLLGKPGAFPKTHDLEQLWRRLRPSLRAIFAEEGNDILEEQIRNFSAVDPSSQAFRYLADTNGMSTLAGLSHINLQNVKEIMDGIAPLLDGAAIGILEMQQAEWEMRAEGSDWW